MAKQQTLYPFVSKLFTLVSDPENGAYISWSDQGDQFTVWAPSEFSTNVLPRYFKHNNFCSFIRQLNIYGFHKCDADSWVFKHEEGFFQRGNQDLLQKIQRRKQTNKRSAPSSTPEEEMSNKVPKLSGDATPSASIVNQPMAVVKPAEKSEDVAYLRTVNDFVIAELNTLKRKNQTQENTIAWLIQELLRSKKEMDEIKRVMKKFSLTDDEGAKTAPTQNALGSQLQQLQELHALHVAQQQQQQQQIPTPQTPGGNVKVEQQWMGGMVDESQFFTVPNPNVPIQISSHSQQTEAQSSNESQYMVEMFPLDIQGAPLPGYGYNS